MRIFQPATFDYEGILCIDVYWTMPTFKPTLHDLTCRCLEVWYK